MQRNHRPHLIPGRIQYLATMYVRILRHINNVASRGICHLDALDFEKVGWVGMGDFSATGTLYPSDRCGKEKVAKRRRALLEARNDPSAR